MQRYARLRLLLRACDITVADLARTLGVSRPLLSAIFNGHHRPMPHLAGRLAAAEIDLARRAVPHLAAMTKAVEEVASHA